MEISQPLAIESFSYSWLLNVKPSLDALEEPLKDSSDEATLKEVDYKMVKSKRFLEEEPQNFNFDTPIPQSSVALVHADELFSNGLIKPAYIAPAKIRASGASDSISFLPVSSLSTRVVCPATRLHCGFLRGWKKSSKRIMQKYFGFFRPLCQNTGPSRKSTRVDDIDRSVWEVKSWSNSTQASPRLSMSNSVSDCYDHESPIYEAVLHCKRSMGK